MATVTIRLDDEKRDELERLARERGSTVSDMLRVAIDGLLRRDVPHSLDMVARRSLALSHEILAHLDPDPDAREAHRRSIKVLSEGYTSEYDREFYGIDTEFPPADGPLAMDILDMFAAVEAALRELDEDAVAQLGDDARHLLRFCGFDYNDRREHRLAEFAEYLINDERWTSLAHHFGDRPNRPRCPNSHHQVVARYERMARAFQAILDERRTAGRIRGADDQGFLDLRELTTVLDAARRPKLPEW